MLSTDHLLQMTSGNDATRPNLGIQNACLIHFTGINCGDPDSLLANADRVAINDASCTIYGFTLRRGLDVANGEGQGD